MDVKILPCTSEHIEKLITEPDTFSITYGLQVIEGYLPFTEALPFMLEMMTASKVWYPWLPYLLVFDLDQALVGLGGFKGVPDVEQAVEIGYSIAPRYQGKGLATSAVCQFIQIAFASGLVERVRAHTLAESNASTRVLQKCGMKKVLELDDSEEGRLWRWEVRLA
jgi:RimJ/RimL family protein N-acetyltransferase